jgi:hypothetical protein
MNLLESNPAGNVVECVAHKMERRSYCLLKLPEGVLFQVIDTGLCLKDIVQLDSATCQHHLRPRYLTIVAKCSLHTFPKDVKYTDCGLRWLAHRNITGRFPELVVKHVTDSFAIGCEQYSSALTCVPNLAAYPWNDPTRNVTPWLKRVVPYCPNVRNITANGLQLHDIDWVKALAIHAPLLEKIHLHFSSKNHECCVYSLLADFARCAHLASNYLGLECLGIETLLSVNSNLTRITLWSCYSMTEDAFARILSLPHIQYIDLDQNETVAGDGDLNITSTTLRYLSLRNFDGLETENQLRILQAFPRKDLLTLNLYCLQNVCDGFARTYANLLREFKDVDLTTTNGYDFRDGHVI